MSEWVVLELSTKAEGEDPDLIRASIRHMIRDADVYLPVSVSRLGGDRVVTYLVDGYAFIRRAHPDEKYFRLEGSRYVQSVITRVTRATGNPVRVLACASEADIDRFRSQVHEEEDQGIGVGDVVLITSGPYRQIRAVVIEDVPENEAVQVHVKLRSKDSIVTMPRSFLRLVEKAPRSHFSLQAQALRGWWEQFRPLLAFDGTTRPLGDAFDRYARFDQWITRGRVLQAGLQAAVRPDFSTSSLIAPFRTFRQLDTWYDRGTSLVGLIRSVEKRLDAAPVALALASVARLDTLSQQVQGAVRWLTPLPSLHPTGLESTYLRLLWFEDVFDRLQRLRKGVDEIEQALQGEPMIENIIIDGHNLAIRCAMVPGLAELTDSQGRPTGGILGFLRCLLSYRKKFACSRITVTWDGSSQRRRALCPSYKANRGQLRSYFEIDFLKGLLPFLGITQVWHPEEEADDVIATLVRGLYRGQQNIVVTTDRDLLQLVTETDRVFVPAVGAGKERYYDVRDVTAEYGVEPGRMVQYRALSGDVSDNLPGVHGFGPKLVSKLLRMYGTVDSLFASSLAGLSPTQHQRLRDAEAHVKNNVCLMALQDNLVCTTIVSNPDQKAAAERLRQVDMKVDSVLPAFFRAV